MLKKSWKPIALTFAFLLLIFIELSVLLLLGPLPITQDMKGTADVSHWLWMNIGWMRILLLFTIIWLSIGVFKKSKLIAKILLGAIFILYGVIFYAANYSLNAGSLFKDQSKVVSQDIENNVVPLDKVVLGIVINGFAKAYPIEYLAFHHKIMDEVGGKAVLPTYCIWCRSGRVFDPVIDGETATFNLVGMTEYNAVLEDEFSKSWWQQATGEAIAGKKKGQQLREVFSEQMPLSQWIEKHPNTQILQPDSLYIDAYEHHSKFVSRYGAEEDGMEYDSWKKRSWVVGVEHEEAAKAFDFETLIEQSIINDEIGGAPIVVLLERDSIQFHAWSSVIDTSILTFSYIGKDNIMIDNETGSTWNMHGACIKGRMKGTQLRPISAYEEYWHSWQNFHPNTEKFGKISKEYEDLE